MVRPGLAATAAFQVLSHLGGLEIRGDTPLD